MLSANFVRYLTELAPHSVGYLPLIMFCLETLARVKIYVVHDDVIMDVRMVYVGRNHILIFIIKQSLAKLLTDKQSTFGSNLARRE